MYLQHISSEFVQDIVRRKEFLINTPTSRSPTDIDKDIHESNKLVLRSYQVFAANYMSLESPVRRLYIKYGTGIGKTLLALNIVLGFLQQFNRIREADDDAPVPNVVILGFTKTIFVDELLRYPELGYVSREELAHMERLRYDSLRGTHMDVERYSEYLTMLRRRITNVRHMSSIKFYGYRAFVNRLFNSNIENMSESEIHAKIKSGEIKLDTELADEFRNSIVVCDEIHNVYNSCEKNNWGITIQAFLNYHAGNIRAMFLSATPINHNPAEVVDLGNLLHSDTGAMFKRSDFFKDCSDGRVILQTGGAEKIGKIFAGRILFLEDSNPKYFPVSRIEGSEIPGITALRFIRCPMSAFHYKTYKAMYTGTIAHDAQYIMDFALPNPTGDLGLYQTQEVKNAYIGADRKWLAENNLVISQDKTGLTISGEILNMKTGRLSEISAKFYRVMQDIQASIRRNGGKIFIYHKFVRMSGVLFIKEIFMRNGIIDDVSEPTDSTLDVSTGLSRAEHRKAAIKSEYRPVRFIIIHSEIDAYTRRQTIERFNHPGNANGDDILIILGAEIIKESYTIKCIRTLMVTFRPDNISTLIQIFGRAKRQGSHRDLPVDKRNIAYRIYVSSAPGASRELTYEESRYRDRAVEYHIIQQIEQQMHRHAADAFINMEMIRNTFVAPGQLGILPFTPEYTHKGVIIRDTYEAYFNEREIQMIIYVIKRLFIEVSPIFTLPDLITKVKDPGFSLEVNPGIFDDDNIRIALFRIVLHVEAEYISTIPVSASNYPIDKLFDPNDKIISYRGVDYVISAAGEYYILSVYNKDLDSIATGFESPYRMMARRDPVEINIRDYVSVELSENAYESRKTRFVQLYKDATPDQFENATCEYNPIFHLRFIEEIIETLYSVLTANEQSSVGGGKKPGITDNVIDFYIRMLFYYDISRDNVIFYGTAREYIRETYALPDSRPIDSEVVVLQDQLSKTNCKWCPEIVQVGYYTRVDTMKHVVASVKKGAKLGKNAPLLPIGHLISSVPRIYHPKTGGWYDAADYDKTKKVYIENKIIVGFQVKNNSGLSTTFKIRPPVSGDIQDSRKVNKGSLCNSWTKQEVLEILRKLGVKSNVESSSDSLCSELRSRLMYLELEERYKGSNIKYFYQYWEQQPI